MINSNNFLQSFLSDYLLKKAPILFFIFSTDGKIIETNDYVQKKLGRDLKNFRDLFVDFTIPEDFSELLAKHSLEKGYSVKTLSGQPVTFYFDFKRFEDCFFAVANRNIDELEAAQTSIFRLNSEYSNLTRELYRKNNELKQLDEMKNRLLGIAAHDLRNPLSVIMGYSELLIDNLASDPEGMGYLSEIKKCTDFQMRLISDILDFSKIEAGKIDLKLEYLDVLNVLEENLRLHRLLSKKKSIDIEMEKDENIPKTFLDPLRIAQVLNNLVSNAIKYSYEATKIFVKVFCKKSDIQISIVDHGQGIPANELDLLFKPFSRTSVKPTKGEMSTGLGLAIARKIVLEHHGKIWAESTLGIGSVFSFTLPVISS
ncbi:MAG: HAMP domain-containing histidine kinase [Candidatus Riflebacteria bacterium]|nr:HAMP domain-containing histidine kinase [Candidatus Riflebacteria bacterium]